MEYLNRVMGIHVMYENSNPQSLPNFIQSRYRVQRVSLDGKAASFMYPKSKLDSVDAVKKHMERVEKTENTPAVLILDHLTCRQKEYLLKAHLPFIVDGKQIYLPFMAVYLQERGDKEEQERSDMLPSSQLLLLLYIYNGCGEMLTSDAVKELGLTATSVSRASKQLEEMGIVKTEKRGVQKIISSELSPKELFAISRSSMLNPVKRTIYVPRDAITCDLLMSGYSALSEYTMLNPPRMKCFASDSIAAWEKASTRKLQSTDDQYEIQLWRYDPRKLSGNGMVDRLSLALSFCDDKDERVEDAIEEMLSMTWEDIDGKRT